MRKSICIMAVAMTLFGAVAPVASAETANRPVMLADAQAFETNQVETIAPPEISEARRELASAVSSEKFLDGVVVAVLLYALIF